MYTAYLKAIGAVKSTGREEPLNVLVDDYPITLHTSFRFEPPTSGGSLLGRSDVPCSRGPDCGRFRACVWYY